MQIITKLKKLFNRKKNPEALKMWDDLSDTYDGDPEFHPDLDLDATYALSLSDKDRNKYLYDLYKRRQEAHEKYK